MPQDFWFGGAMGTALSGGVGGWLGAQKMGGPTGVLAGGTIGVIVGGTILHRFISGRRTGPRSNVTKKSESK